MATFNTNQNSDGTTAGGVRANTSIGKVGDQNILYVPGIDVADKPSILALDAVSDLGVRTTYYLWVDSTGDLRIGSTIPTNQDSDGAVVGAQS